MNEIFASVRIQRGIHGSHSFLAHFEKVKKTCLGMGYLPYLFSSCGALFSRLCEKNYHKEHVCLGLGCLPLQHINTPKIRLTKKNNVQNGQDSPYASIVMSCQPQPD